MKLLTGLLLTGTMLFASAESKEFNLTACLGCHGQNFEKTALGQSRIVKDLPVDEVAISLLAYKDGTKTTPLAQLMKAQIKQYTPQELLLIAEQIGKSEDTKF